MGEAIEPNNDHEFREGTEKACGRSGFSCE